MEFPRRRSSPRRLAARIREHCRLAAELAGWVDEHPDWERLAPTPFSTVCLRYRPHDMEGDPDAPAGGERLDALNERIIDEVNRGGRIYLSHTKLRDRSTIRVTLGNLRQTEEWVRTCWETLSAAARKSREE